MIEGAATPCVLLLTRMQTDRSHVTHARLRRTRAFSTPLRVFFERRCVCCVEWRRRRGFWCRVLATLVSVFGGFSPDRASFLWSSSCWVPRTSVRLVQALPRGSQPASLAPSCAVIWHANHHPNPTILPRYGNQDNKLSELEVRNWFKTKHNDTMRPTSSITRT